MIGVSNNGYILFLIFFGLATMIIGSFNVVLLQNVSKSSNSSI